MIIFQKSGAQRLKILQNNSIVVSIHNQEVFEMRKLFYVFVSVSAMLSMCSCEPAPADKTAPVKKSSQTNPSEKIANKVLQNLHQSNAGRNAEYEKAAK